MKDLYNNHSCNNFVCEISYIQQFSDNVWWDNMMMMTKPFIMEQPAI